MAMGKSHDFLLVASRTWNIFSHDIRDGRRKVMLGQRYQESYLVERDSSAFSSRHGSAIGTPNGGEAETQGPFQLPTCILGFLLIFKRSQASSNFESFISG